MRVVICYDVDDSKIRRKLVKYLEGIAVRIQYSVFISDLNDRAIKQLQNYAGNLMKNCANAKFVVFKTADSNLYTEKIPSEFIYI